MPKYNKKVKNAKEWKFDNILFKSGLELFCYKQLSGEGIPCLYEPSSFELIPALRIDFQCYESIGKIYRDDKKKITNSTKRFDLVPTTRGISYTPDFIDPNGRWIIETKGYSNDSFPLRWKLYKKYLAEVGFTGILMKPENHAEILQCIEIIKNDKKEVDNNKI